MEFKDKFARDDKHNSMALTADGCMQRLNLPRNEMDMSRHESIAKERGSNVVEFSEYKLQCYLGQLQRKGIPLVESSVEQYIINNMSEIEEIM